jgi:hypothetical protein
MKSAEDIESYLIQMDAHYENVEKGFWLVKGQGPDIVVNIAGPVVVFRVKVLDAEKIPKEKREEFYRKVLEFNSGEMLHGAYGLEDNSLVVTDALELENLDYNEFQATMDDMSMAVSNHYKTLAGLAA